MGVLTPTTVGYGNLYGGVNVLPPTWAARRDGIAAAINGFGTDLFFCVELQEKVHTGYPDGVHQDMLNRLQTLDPDWRLAPGRQANQLFYKVSRYVMETTLIRLPTNGIGINDLVAYKMIDLTTNVEFVGAVTHLPPSGAEPNAQARIVAATAVRDYMSGVGLGFFVGDFNTATMRAGYPRDIWKQAGWAGLQVRGNPTNKNRDSYSGAIDPDGRGQWIDDIMTRTSTPVSNEAMVPTGGLSDHWGWMRATITFDTPAPLPPTAINIYSEYRDPRLVPAPTSDGAPFTITVFDKDFQRVGWIGDPTSITVTVRHLAIGSLEMVLPADHRRVVDLAAEGARLTVDHDGLQVFSGWVSQLSGSSTEGVSQVTVTAQDDLSVLWDVLAYPIPANPVETQSGQADARSGLAETVIKGYAAENFTRLVQPISVVESLGRGGQVEVSMRMVPLADQLIDAAEKGGLGITVRQVEGELLFDCYVPRPYYHALTEASGTVLEYTWTRAAPTATRAVIGGPNAGTSREFKGTVNTLRERLYGRTIETFVDAQSETTTPKLIAAGQAALDEAAPKSGLSLTLAEGEIFSYGLKGVLVGDTLTVGVGPASFTEILREAQLSWTADEGFSAEPKVGERTDDPDVVLGESVAALAKGLRTYRTR